jgi:HEAT repeat protein
VWALGGVGLLLVLLIGVRVYIVWRAARAIGDTVEGVVGNINNLPPPPNAPPNWPFGSPPPANLDEAVAALKDNDLNRRVTAARWLAKTPVDNQRRAEVAGALEPLLVDRNATARVAGVQALEVWAGTENVPAILRLLDSNPTGFEGDECRKRSIDTLVRLKDPRAAAPVARNFKQHFEREWTRRSLIALGPAAEDAVIPYLEDEDWGVRVEACHTLKQIGTRPKALPALQTTLEGTRKMYSGYKFVADAAKEAIEAIKARP